MRSELKVSEILWKSWSCFSTAFLNFFFCLISMINSSTPGSSRKLWENMAIQDFAGFLLLAFWFCLHIFS
ncbi:hypothetical protein CIPAW_03G248100 [Carya illinoinensis]|uniref:Uncharacterized protein n=1 Tax=Carya illinoinensis TaxID=32201 RepID=A0A8T1R8T8_CARIL|nr:hypothetical protein CIPAW_03G248100 [Carya illinoinensis]